LRPGIIDNDGLKVRLSLPRTKTYTLIKSDLTHSIYHEIGLSQKESSELVKSIFTKIESALVRGETVKLAGFGTFATRDKSERIGRNPKTGKAVVIAPRRVLSFKPSEKLNARINKTLSNKETR
jgi:integration host factor subunit alpha